jgi:hypothetical protein
MTWVNPGVENANPDARTIDVEGTPCGQCA